MFFENSPENITLINDIHNSCLGCLSECLVEMKSLGLLSETASLVPIEGHAEIEELPATDLLFFDSFMLSQQDKLIRFGFQVGVSIFKDTNCYKHYKAISYLFSRFSSLTSFSIVSSDGKQIGSGLTVDGVVLNQIENANSRCLQMIDVSCACDLTL